MSIIAGQQATANLTVQELPSLLKEWMQIQDQIETLNGEIKQRRKKSKALRDVIMRIMDSNKISTLNVSRGAVVHEAIERKKTLSQEALFKHYKNFFEGNEEKAKALMEYLEGQKQKVVKHELSLYPPPESSDSASGGR
jgi:hypothetical protein